MLSGIQHKNEIILSTNGGRYDINLRERSRHAIYWDEAPSKVRRCTWFYKSDGENKFVPYEEDLAGTLEVSLWYKVCGTCRVGINLTNSCLRSHLGLSFAYCCEVVLRQ